MADVLEKKLQLSGGAGNLAAVTRGRKETKFINVKTVEDGILFDSKAEVIQWRKLKQLERYKVITNLQYHQKFYFELNAVKIGYYESDFTFIQDGKLIVQDVKSDMSRKLPVYRLKRKMMLAFHGIEIVEV